MQAIETTFENALIPSYIDQTLLEAFAEYQGVYDAEEALEAFEDCYQGTFASTEEWAESLLEDTGELEAIPAHLRPYFDYEAYGRDCELNGDIWTMDVANGVAIFWSR